MSGGCNVSQKSLWRPKKVLLKKNVVEPSTNENQNENEVSAFSEDNTRSKNYLFSSKISKSKKSYYVTVTAERILYVEHYAQTDRDLFTEIQGDIPSNYNTAIVLFFIHGVGGSAQMWEPQIQYFLFEGYEIITFDLLGHGLSTKPNNYESYYFMELAQDVLAVFDRFHKKKNVLIGHSYGSSFCTYLAKERSNLVTKLVLISSGGPTTLMPDSCSPFCVPFPLFYAISPAVVKLFRR